MEYLKQVIDTKKIDEPRQKLLLHLLNCRVDYRVLAQMKQYLFDRFPGDQDIPVESFKKEASRYLHVYPQDIQDKITADLSTDDTQQLISRQRLLELTEMYQYLPLKVKRDKNKSEDIYFIMNSNKRGAPQSKEQLLQELKDSNEKMYVAKIITLVAIKLEEKFHTMAKAFLFFDIDNDRRITRAEFAKGVDGLRVKLTKDDVDKVFDYLDKDCDQALDYQEFCGLSEEKRRNIDPFEIQHHSVTSLKPREVNIGHYASLENSISRVSADSQGSLADVIARRNASTNKYEDLESKAAQMNLINLKDTLKQRQISVPKKVMGNHNHTFGMKSTAHLGGVSQLNRSPSKAGSDTESHMKSIMQHTDNLREDLERKIQMKMQLDLLRKK
jgi:Ca2+-binding EF-hand superfamily protein